MSVTQIQSSEIIIDRPVNRVYDFLVDLSNYRALMPPEVDLFEGNAHKVNLSLKGLGNFDITLGQTTVNKRIELLPKGKLPFTFNIEWLLSSRDNSTAVQGMINADLNVFMKMMAEAKLKDFVSTQASKMKTLLESEIDPI